MPTAKVPGTNATIRTHHVEPGVYDVFLKWNEPNVTSPHKALYQIHRVDHAAGWSLLDAEHGTLLVFDQDTIQTALDCIAARVEHDRAWGEYQTRLVRFEKVREDRTRRNEEGESLRLPRMRPQPDTRKIDTDTGHLQIKTKIVACRLGEGDHMPAFHVLVNDVEIGQICLFRTRWFIHNTRKWYAGPNHEWSNLHHSDGAKLPEEAASFFARKAMETVIDGYMSTEISRRDAQVAEEERHPQSVIE